MTAKELHETLEMRKSKLDDPDFSVLPSEMKTQMIIEITSIVCLGMLLAYTIIAFIGSIIYKL